MSKFIDLTGQKFGSLMVIERYKDKSDTHIKWVCRCDCGVEKVVRGDGLKKGRVVSCGCSKVSRLKDPLTRPKHFLTHGLSKHPLYSLWNTIKGRCTNPNDKDYRNYGGRGIYVCDEWSTSFASFMEWATSNGWSKGLQVDRIDNNKGYSPENCHFVAPRENSLNRRNTLKLGKWKSLRNVSEKIGVFRDKKSYERLKYFMEYHGSLSESLSFIGGI